MDGRAAIGKLLGSVQSAFTRTRRLRARIRPENTSTIHRTRVAFKHFRYMVEGLSRFLPGVNEKRLRKMREYQAMMGDIQDMEVLLQALDKFIGRKKVHSQSAQRLREEVLRWRLWLIRIYLDVAGQLEGFWDGKAIKSAVEGRQRNNT